MLTRAPVPRTPVPANMRAWAFELSFFFVLCAARSAEAVLRPCRAYTGQIMAFRPGMFFRIFPILATCITNLVPFRIDLKFPRYYISIHVEAWLSLHVRSRSKFSNSASFVFSDFLCCFDFIWSLIVTCLLLVYFFQAATA